MPFVREYRVGRDTVNITMKAHSIKTLYPEPAQQELGKICQISRRASLTKYFFNKIAYMQYTFARIRLFLQLPILYMI